MIDNPSKTCDPGEVKTVGRIAVAMVQLWILLVTLLTSALTVELQFVPPSSSVKECEDAGGACGTVSTCKGTRVKWLCEGDDNCCFATEKLCETTGARCQITVLPCEGPYLDGLCGSATLRRCCFETDIMRINTTGASAKTARSDRLKFAGVEASYSIAATDLKNLLVLEKRIISVSRRTGVDAALIAAIISRESRGDRKLLDEGGYARTKTRAYGGMQMKTRVSSRGPFSEEHFLRATELFVNKIKLVLTSHPNWSKENILKGAVAAYNMGERHVWTVEHMDKGTNNDDYANDVIARAQWYKANGYFADVEDSLRPLILG